jgi:ABC-type dipeptide/oligopeptide/nickel transport system permease subunit
MAQSHHRKKHKEHLTHFQHRREQVAGISKKGKSTWPLAIIGAIAGLLVVYLSVGENILGIMAGVAVGGAIGYFIGHRMDNSTE